MQNNNFFESELTKNNINFFIANTVYVVLIVVVFMAIKGQAFYNVLLGPFNIVDLNKIPELTFENTEVFSNIPTVMDSVEKNPIGYGNYSQDGKYYFTVRGYGIYHTGVENVSYSNAIIIFAGEEHVNADYLLLQMYNKFLIVKAPPGSDSKTFSGVFAPIFPEIKEDVLKGE